ncbi:MAG: hypothetical protein AAF125_27870, partial [Chloroflexota bacterium]
MLHLQSEDAEPYQDLIMNACLTPQSYDPQVEGFRQTYLNNIIKLTGKPDFYRAAVREAAETLDLSDEQRWHPQHFAHLLKAFAQDGDDSSRHTLYNLFLRGLAVRQAIASTEIIELDGLEGFIFVVQHLWEVPNNITSDYLLRVLEEVIGEDEAAFELTSRRRTNPKLHHVLQAMERERVRFRRRARRRRQHDPGPVLYAEVQRRLSSGEYIDLVEWGKRAYPSEIEKAAADLPHIGDLGTLNKVLRLFRKKPYP